MFTWVCPRCGRENSPSYTECPDCAVRDREAAAAQPVVVAEPVYAPDVTRAWQQPPQIPAQPPVQPQYAPVQPQYAQPAPQYVPQQPQYAPPQPQYAPPQYAPQPPQYQQPLQQYPPQAPYAAPQQLPPVQVTPVHLPLTAAPQQPPPRPTSPPLQTTQETRQLPPLKTSAAPAKPSGLAALPTWLLMLLFAAAFLAVGAGIYYGYRAYNSGPAGFTGGQPAATASKAKPSNPLQKYVEVVGVRLTSDPKKKPVAKFLVVNHSDGVLNDLSGTVTLWASTSRSEEDSVGSFLFHIDTLKPNDSKDFSAPLKTKLKMYELPDWQNVTAELQITSPQ